MARMGIIKGKWTNTGSKGTNFRKSGERKGSQGFWEFEGWKAMIWESFSELVQIALVDGLSLLVRDPASGNKLIAVRLANIIRREGEMRENEVGVRNENGGEHRNGVGGEQRNGKQQKQRKKSSGAFREDREENEKVRQISGILHIVEDKVI